jgi:hypothetical protein
MNNFKILETEDYDIRTWDYEQNNERCFISY